MNSKSRINSILNTTCLDSTVTGLQSFNLSELNHVADTDFELPKKLRLGHLAEKIVSELLKSSSNYDVLFENVQVMENKRTIGELDFIIQNNQTKQLTHLELAYKFYLYDPSISSEVINCWIGPNRNDSLSQKLEKLKSKQFPLLYNQSTKANLENIDISKVRQALCLLSSLYIPYLSEHRFSQSYQEAIKGYYFNMEEFIGLDHTDKTYYLPAKKEWGMDPSEQIAWSDFDEIINLVQELISERQAPLCWEKKKDNYSTYFIVWW